MDLVPEVGGEIDWTGVGEEELEVSAIVVDLADRRGLIW
jgi:hypothetical protein